MEQVIVIHQQDHQGSVHEAVIFGCGNENNQARKIMLDNSDNMIKRDLVDKFFTSLHHYI